MKQRMPWLRPLLMGIALGIGLYVLYLAFGVLP